MRRVVGGCAGRIVREGRDETKTESEKGVEGKRAKERMARRERDDDGRKVIVEGKLLLEELSRTRVGRRAKGRDERGPWGWGNMDEYTES